MKAYVAFSLALALAAASAPSAGQPLALPPGVTMPPCMAQVPAPAAAGQTRFTGQWSGAGFQTFRHVVEGAPGRVNLNLQGCSSSPGGETVAVYMADRNGNKKGGWRLFVIATRQGNGQSGTLVIPRPARGQATASVPIMVVVENASGRPQVGHYSLTVTR